MTFQSVYLKNNVEGMDKDELVLFVYAELVKVLYAAKHHFETNDIEQRVVAINKGIEVISVLLNTLDFSAGPIASQLRSLYVYAIRQLTQANYDRRPELVDEVSRIFRGLHDAWRQKMDRDRVQGRDVVPQNVPASRVGEARNLELFG